MGYTNKYNHLEDGKTHLNTYSKAKTEIGRFLSNFAKSPIDTPDGKFNSIEGYWHWLGTNESPERENFRYMYGSRAKQLAKILKVKNGKRFEPDFENKIKTAMKNKFDNNEDLLLKNIDLLKLPITHYYTFVRDGNVLVYDAEPDFQWMIDYIRKYLNDFVAKHEI